MNLPDWILAVAAVYALFCINNALEDIAKAIEQLAEKVGEDQ